MSSSPSERRWNGDEDVATPFFFHEWGGFEARSLAVTARVGIGIGIGIGIENEVENTIRFRSRGTVTSTSSPWPLGSPRDSLSGNSGLKRSILNPSADWNADAYS